MCMANTQNADTYLFRSLHTMKVIYPTIILKEQQIHSYLLISNNRKNKNKIMALIYKSIVLNIK